MGTPLQRIEALEKQVRCLKNNLKTLSDSFNMPEMVDVEVPSTGIPIGASTINLPQFRGWDILFFRMGVAQNKKGSVNKYSWNHKTGILDITGAVTGEFEQLLIVPHRRILD